ncbi:MAG: T9SS type A sorting domain-containing protein [Saprospiraceae bacterium]|nr:T9SS type A sorting domain-containing protein [Saprospiraceae bacterium]
MKYTQLLLVHLILVILVTSLHSQPLLPKWKNLNGPDGGCILHFETDGSQLYALTKGGVFTSQNAGESWKLLDGPRNLIKFGGQLVVEQGVLYLLNEYGICLRSRNAGASWTSVLQPPFLIDEPLGKPQKIHAIGDTIIVASALGIYRSVNQGDTWEIATVPYDYYALEIKDFVQIGQDIFLTYGKVILKSTDGGSTWKKNYVSGFTFADITATDSVLYALYDGFPRLIRSFDRGLHWESIDTDTIEFYQYNDETDDWLTAIGGQLYYCSDYGCIHGGVLIFQSGNFGDEWGTSERSGLKRHYMNDLFVLPEHLLAATEQGVFRSTDDAQSFHPFHSGMSGAWVKSIHKLTGGRWWVETMQGIFATDTDGLSWDLKFPGQLEEPCRDGGVQLHTTQKRLFYTEKRLGYHLWMSEDGGETWTDIFPLPYSYANVASSQHNFWISSDSKLYLLSDEADNLKEIILPFSGRIYQMIATDNKVFIETEGQFFLSEDRGESWQNIENTVTSGQDVIDLNFMDKHGLFGATGQWYSDTTVVYDFETKVWRPIFPVAESDSLKSWDFNYLHTLGEIRLFNIYNKGLFFSTIDEPEKMHRFFPVLPFHKLTSARFDPLHQKLWVGSGGAGIYTISLPVPASLSAVPDFQVAPNPSTGNSLLQAPYFVTEHMLFRVFDSSGKLVHRTTLPPGQFWEINLVLPTGVYFWQVLTTQGTVTLKWVKF